MGIYAEQVMPRVVNAACGAKTARPNRTRVCADLTGEVIEIGFGTGHNVPFYPAAVTRVAAVEPADLAWKLAAKRVAQSDVPVERSGLDGEALPFLDDTFDSALSTWTMCTIPDLEAALLELRRVLRPGGTLHFLEHGYAPDESVVRWQYRLEPMNKRMLGGCHLARKIGDAVRDAGFDIVELEQFYEKGTPKPMGALSLGIAGSA